MAHKGSRSSISTGETKNRPPTCSLWRRRDRWPVILSFLKPQCSNTPVRKNDRLHLCNVTYRRKTNFRKICFLTFAIKTDKYAKTPHFRAVFSVLRLSSTHSGRSDATWTHGLLVPNQALCQLSYTPLLIVLIYYTLIRGPMSTQLFQFPFFFIMLKQIDAFRFTRRDFCGII